MQIENQKSAACLLPDLPSLLHKLESIRKDASNVEERLDGVLYDLKGQVEKAPASPSPAPPPPAVRESPPPPDAGPEPAPEKQRKLDLQRQAAAGANSVRITPASGGSVLIQIDGRQELRLPPALGVLFQALCDDSGASPDVFVGWKTVADLKTALAKRIDGAFSTHAIKQLVYRLRKELERLKENQFLIQTSRKLGYRFALRRGGDL